MNTTPIIKETTKTITVFTTRDGTEFSDKQSALLHELRGLKNKAISMDINPFYNFENLAEFIGMFPEVVPLLIELNQTFTDQSE